MKSLLHKVSRTFTYQYNNHKGISRIYLSQYTTTKRYFYRAYVRRQGVFPPQHMCSAVKSANHLAPRQKSTPYCSSFHLSFEEQSNLENPFPVN
ncbi:hypothetical protein CDAR_272141 [Caerostris darwini]|uniref:Uncharacterized protein n=1 Tax=Caerostris darwini TaxID=1538125 RepID=A0AAV4UZ86_9ARAC|nr:hypothetical protein CDAR_272141 [Caerostris darwini]